MLTYENGEPQVACYDLTSRQLLSRLAGCRAPMCFSARGRCLAAVHGTSLAVFDVRIGRQIAMLDSPEAGIASPMEFSPDESLLLDSHGNVWNLPSGTRRFGISQLSQSCTFTPDGLKLVGVVASGSESWLAYYDVFTGKEQLDRRVSLVNGEDPRMGIHKTRPGGRWLIAVGGAHIEKPPVWEMWIAKLKSFRSWAEGRFVLTSVVVETATGQEIAQHGFVAVMHLRRPVRIEPKWPWSRPAMGCAPAQAAPPVLSRGCCVVRHDTRDFLVSLSSNSVAHS